MKKRVVFLFMLLLLVLPFLTADNSTDVSIDTSGTDEDAAVSAAYDCIKDKVEDDCSTSLEANIFTLLAIKKCKSEVLDESKSDKCWPKSGCTVKRTAQAVLALDRAGTSTGEAEDWLLDQETTPEDMIWYLQIESPEETTCEISYSGSYDIVIDEDKTLSSGAGSCLSLSENGYWLRISQNCYDEEFEITCDQQFLTNLLFKKKTSSTIHVSEETHSASAEGTTTEYVNCSCFEGDDGECDYEGTLWATLTLNKLDYDTEMYLSYLVAMADENNELLPESFIYSLTDYSDFRNELLLKQKSGKYWDESGDKFFDTALALLPFQYEEPSEKENSIDWFLEVQGSDGCWQGNLRNTAFILYSVWPRSYSSDDGGGTNVDCEDAGYYCMSSVSCEGEILSGYDCAGVAKCCDTPKSLESCLTQGGEICNSAQICTGGTTVEAGDTDYGETCCVGGSCAIPVEQTECESYGGTCRSFCHDDEQENSDECNFGDVCCMTKTSSSSYWWIWLLIILIILTILGIVFRKKLRPYWFRIKSWFDKFKKSKKPPTPPPSPMQRPGFRRPMQRRILHPSAQHRPGPRPPMQRKSKPEIDDILKKLKEMGK